MAAAKVIIRIPHVIWREGRPRFTPGPALRRLGHKGRDLKDVTGAWFALDATIAFSNTVAAEVAGQRQAREQGKRTPRASSAAAVYSVAHLVADALAQSKYLGHVTIKGKRTVKPKAATTVASYHHNAKVLQKECADIWASPVAAITRATAKGVINKIHENRGLHVARQVHALLRMSYSFGITHGRAAINPWSKLDVESPAPRVRVATVAEIAHLIRTADEMGRPEIGDCILLGALTGQRQNDRLGSGMKLADGKFELVQSKTDEFVKVKSLLRLSERLAAAKARRATRNLQWPHLIIDEKQNRPFAKDHYRHLFAEVRDAAAKAEGFESLADFRDQDLRDTAIVWMARGGATIPQIASVSGHSLKTVHEILKHYMGRDNELAEAAADAMQNYINGKGVQL
jgi:hypothetical protein